MRFRLTSDEVLCQRRACVFLSHDASEEEHRTAWPVIHNEMLTLAFGVARHGYDNASGLALDFTSVFLKISFAPVVAREVKFLVLIDLASLGDEVSYVLRPLQNALHRRTFSRYVVG
jgi:hypothetical protein